jgi:hypothetical protein
MPERLLRKALEQFMKNARAGLLLPEVASKIEQSSEYPSFALSTKPCENLTQND